MINQLTIKSEELEKKLFPILRHKVFHVTHQHAYTSIIKDSFIKHNADGKFNHGFPKSENNFAQRNKLVSLFDLKYCPPEKLSHVEDSFYFYNPDYTKNNPHFFIAKDNIRDNLISWEVPHSLCLKGEKPGNFIHYGEYYFPNKLPIELIEKVIIVKII